MENSFNLLNIVVSLGVGLTGVFVGWYLTKYKESVKYALELHKEYNSAEMCKFRTDGWKLVSENLFLPIKEIHIKFGNDCLGVLMVLRFYQRLWVAIDEGEIPKKLAIKLFSELFFYWYTIYYQEYSKSDWTAVEDLHSLAKWYKKAMPREMYDKLLDRHTNIRIELIQKNK